MPADAEAASHQLLVRAGYIRRVASGIYALLPFGLRVLRNIERITRQELDGIGGQELLLPVLQPIELWEQSGRRGALDDAYGAFHVEGRGGHFVLGPTHEEIVTTIAGADIESYRDLPQLVYQMAVKFRDEARPRFGLLRGREFLMKDAYSFDADNAAMAVTYDAVVAAYRRILDRCAVQFEAVEASSGAFGGAVNHEFMVPSAIGEDRFARCGACGWAANLELGRAATPQTLVAFTSPMQEHHTPGRPGIDLVVEYFNQRAGGEDGGRAEDGVEGLTADGMLKCIAFMDADGPVVALVPGDREVLPRPGWRTFEGDDFEAHPHLVKGYVGPMGLQAHGVRVVADWATNLNRYWTTGANKADHHVANVVLDRDFTVDEWAPLTEYRDGDVCPSCAEAALALVQSVEVAHAFQLGDRYSKLIPGGTYRSEAGAEEALWMGCYGVGLSRLIAVIAEAHHDTAGLVWPTSVTPYDLHLVALSGTESEAADLYSRLGQDRVLYDDRDASAGVKFADADLIGVPTQVILGSKGLARGVVEVKDRVTGERSELSIESAAASL